MPHHPALPPASPCAAADAGPRAAGPRAGRPSRPAVRGRRVALAIVACLSVGSGVAPAASAEAERRPGVTALSGETVRAAQRALGVTDDGIMGPVTRRAIRRLQKARGLRVTGRLDRRTRAVLGLGARASTPPAPVPGGAAPSAPAPPAESSHPPVPAEVRPTLERIAQCESGGDPAAVSPDGSYRGKYQFSVETWRSVGGNGDPAAAPEREQDHRAHLLLQRAGTAPWPHCGAGA